MKSRQETDKSLKTRPNDNPVTATMHPLNKTGTSVCQVAKKNFCCNISKESTLCMMIPPMMRPPPLSDHHCKSVSLTIIRVSRT